MSGIVNGITLRVACLSIAAIVSLSCARAEPRRPIAPPFNATLSNNVPLVFGMDPASAATALQTPLAYVSGRPGNEIFLALRDVGGGGFFERRDRLFLQFRHGRLTGWKGDWGRNWMWR